jgi:hypothetical protein
MAIGPVQLIVLGFPQPDFHGEIIDELERLRQGDTVRVIDALAVYSDEDARDVLGDIPNGSAAALILLEHHWAVGRRAANARAGGFRVRDGFISPLDLIGIGLVTAEEAAELHSLETASATT